MKKIYRQLEALSYSEAIDILNTGDETELLLLPLRVGENLNNWKQAQTICIQLFFNSNPKIRANAALGLAYVARTKGKLEKDLVKPYLLKELRENEENRWRIMDAIHDINLYLGWHIAEKSMETYQSK